MEIAHLISSEQYFGWNCSFTVPSSLFSSLLLLYDYRHRPLVETATVDGAGGMEPTLAAQMEPQGLSSFLNEA